jgi:hypothetical protein
MRRRVETPSSVRRGRLSRSRHSTARPQITDEPAQDRNAAVPLHRLRRSPSRHMLRSPNTRGIELVRLAPGARLRPGATRQNSARRPVVVGAQFFTTNPPKCGPGREDPMMREPRNSIPITQLAGARGSLSYRAPPHPVPVTGPAPRPHRGGPRGRSGCRPA